MLNYIKGLFTSPLFEDDDKTRIAYYLNAISLSASGVLVLFLIIRNLSKVEFALSIVDFILIGFIVLLLASRYSLVKGYVNTASNIVVGSLWIGLAYLAWDGDGIRDATFVALFVVILIASLLLGTRAALIYTTLSIATGIAFLYLQNIGAYQPRTLDALENFTRDLSFIFILFGIILYLLTSSLNNALTRARKTALEFKENNEELQLLQTALENRVEERTSELEESVKQSVKRAAQFEAIAQVTREISTSQDIEFLLPRITNVISKQFGFYHVGIFLLDSNKEYAVLRAANSEGGQKMLAREHKLGVGETGIVGYVTSRGQARIALDTGTDAVYFDNPDLPNTRSEMALPMLIGDQVIGALDVQSTEANAFSKEDTDILTTLASQVGIAIQNARLFEETRNALIQAQILSQQTTALGWNQYIRAQKLTGIRHSKAKTTLLQEPVKTNQAEKDNSLDLPITLRGQQIGEIKVKSDAQQQWTQDEIEIASAIIERAAIALENARLLSDAQRRAMRERVIGEISSTVSTSTDMEDILRNAVQELGRRLGGAEVVLELGTEQKESDLRKSKEQE